MPIHIDVKEFVEEIAPLYLGDKFTSIAEEAYKKGRAVGLAEARLEGMAMILIKTMEHRFGPLDAESRAQILGANEETLLRWNGCACKTVSFSELLD